MDAAEFKKGEEVLYLDRSTGKHLPAVVEAVDYSIIPPSYLVRIPELDTVRETVASRLSHRVEPATVARAPAEAAPAVAAVDNPKSNEAAQPQEEGTCSIPPPSLQPVGEPQTPPRDAFSQPPTPPAPLKKKSKSKRRRQRSRQQQHLGPVVRAPEDFGAVGSEHTACDVPVAHFEPRAQRPAASQRSCSSRGRQAGVSCAAHAPRQAYYGHADPWGWPYGPDPFSFGFPLSTW